MNKRGAVIWCMLMVMATISVWLGWAILDDSSNRMSHLPAVWVNGTGFRNDSGLEGLIPIRLDTEYQQGNVIKAGMAAFWIFAMACMSFGLRDDWRAT